MEVELDTMNIKFKLVILWISILMMSTAWAHDPDNEDAAADSDVTTTQQDSDGTDKGTVKVHGIANPVAQTDAEKAAALAKAATDPSAVLAQLGFFFWTESSSDNKNIANTGLFQPVLPLSKKNVLRPALPVIITGGPNGKTGIGDLFLLDVQIEKVSTGSFGWGGVASLPIATEDTMGTGKWSAGPMFMYMNKTLPKDLLGILAYQEWSFAGKSDRNDVSKFTFQPIWVHHTGWGYVGWTDLIATIDFENDNQFSFPVGLRFGTVFHAKTPLNVNVQPYYTFNNKGKDDVWGIKFSATFIKPGWLHH